MKDTKLCKHCKTEIPKRAKVCPNCRKKQSGFMKWILVVLLALIVISALSGSGENEEKEQPISTEVSDGKKENEKKEDNVPSEYKSALKKAENYSDTMHMSKAGIYNQLTSEYGEKFAAEAAQYAMDNLEVDWKENALKRDRKSVV